MRTSRFSAVAALATATAVAACSDDNTSSPGQVDAADADALHSDAADAANPNDTSSTGDTTETGAGGADASDAGSVADADATIGADGSSTDGGDAAPSDALSTTSVTLRFKAKVGAADFACGTTYPGQGATGVAVQPRDFRMYVSSVFLVDGGGNKVPVTLATRSPWQTSDVALLDFEDGTGSCSAEGTAEMNDSITGTVPPGVYDGIVFSNVVSDALSHADPLTAPPPLQLGAMTWGWLYGFKFVKAELAAVDPPTGDAAPGLGLLHLGSTGCTNATDAGDNFNAPPTVACSTLNHNEIHLTGFDPATSVIIADIGALFLATDLSQDNQCHSEGPACPPLFGALGVSYASGAGIPSQTMFRVE